MINKIGVVGTGEIANQFVSQLDKENYSVISVYNHRKVTLKAFVEKFGIKEYHTNYDEFLMNESMDCVYIATPNQTHYDFVLKALNSGKHVLCEKVMVLEGQQAEELFNLAEQKGLVLLEAVTLFFMPLYQQILTYLNNEKLGKLSGVNVTFGSCKEYDPENRFFSPEKGGGALFDIGTYALSAAVYLLGTDLKMIATDVEFSKSGVDEKSVTLLKNAEGLQASVMISFRGKMPKQIILTGDKGYLMINDFPRAEKATIFYNDGEKEIIELGNGRDVFTYEMDLLNQYNKGNIKGCDVRQVTKQVIS
ncbi:MAG: Gfo/Idh/MocA family oxidoreductase, partial [Vagococcus sp.]|uniref:Gfo/Idh/MocA family protein n=1 Tax=Vagococcus sp. TaxID=1933889 RepID=UPI002FC93265